MGVRAGSVLRARELLDPGGAEVDLPRGAGEKTHERGRPVENKWIGQRIDEPDIDLAMMARAQGAVAIGPVKDLSKLKDSMAEAVKAVQDGAVCVVDVRVVPGYDSNMSGGPAAASKR